MDDLRFHPLTPERWDDFERLFGPHGAYGGCWCMWWRSSRAEFQVRGGQGNKQAIKELVEQGVVPGILAYRDGEPLAWCSVAPREDFASLERSRVLKRLDDRPVWSIVCFYIPRRHEGQGLMQALIQAAVEYVRELGGRTVEAYPTVPRNGKLPPVSSFMGIPAVFERVGFVQVARPSQAKVVLRYEIE